MSTTAVIKVWCDGSFPDCQDSIQTMSQDVDRVRSGLARHGWVHVGKDFDLCPNCAAKTSTADLVQTAREWTE